MTQNEFEHPSPQDVGEINSNPIRGFKPWPAKRGETIAPNKTVSTALTWIEHPNQSVREEKLAPTTKYTRKTYPASVCKYHPAGEGKRPPLCTRINKPSGGGRTDHQPLREDEQTSRGRDLCVRVSNRPKIVVECKTDQGRVREGEEWADMGGVGNWVRLTASHNHHHFSNKFPQP